MFEFRLANKSYKIDLEENYIESIRIYGSFVRGDYDSRSDLDFFIVIEDCNKELINRIKGNIAYQLRVPLYWITLFTKSDLKERCNKGDYFTWSVKLEGITLYSRTGFIEDVFKNMRVYSLNGIRDELSSAYNNLQKKILAPATCKKQVENKVYLIASMIRSICININYMNGIVSFSNLDAAEQFLEVEGEASPFTLMEYKVLLHFKREFKSSPADELNFKGNLNKFVDVWVKKLIALLNMAVKKLVNISKTSFKSPLLNS